MDPRKDARVLHVFARLGESVKLARHADHLVGTHRDRYLGSELVSEHLRRSAADARVPRRIFRVRRRGEQRCPARIGHLLSPRDAARDRRTPVVLGDKHQCDVAACIQDALLSGGEQTSCSVVFAEHHVGSLNCGRTARGAGWPARRDVDRVYRRSIPLTASNTAAWTSAPTRLVPR